jgi:hypothetical protein
MSLAYSAISFTAHHDTDRHGVSASREMNDWGINRNEEASLEAYTAPRLEMRRTGFKMIDTESDRMAARRILTNCWMPMGWQQLSN